MSNRLQNYRDQFLLINECKDAKVKNKQLAALMTDMENEFSIPALKNEEFNKANRAVMALYQDVGNARLMEIKQITREEADKIIAIGSTGLQSYEPWGLFYYITKDRDNNTLYVAIDNSDGHCWVEEFYSIGACMAWLRGDSHD